MLLRVVQTAVKALSFINLTVEVETEVVDSCYIILLTTKEAMNAVAWLLKELMIWCYCWRLWILIAYIWSQFLKLLLWGKSDAISKSETAQSIIITSTLTQKISKSKISQKLKRKNHQNHEKVNICLFDPHPAIKEEY